MKLQLIKVGNGSPNYPGDFTLREQKLIKKHSTGRILNLFSGISLIGEVRVDFGTPEATINMDVFKFLEDEIDCDFQTVIIDAAYNKRFADKYQKIHDTPKQFIIFANVPQTRRLFTLISEKINPAMIIIKSWNYYVPASYSEERSLAYLCYAGGFRKSTILMICKK